MAIGTPNLFQPSAAAVTNSGSPCATTTTADAPAGSLIVVGIADEGNNVVSALVDSAGNSYLQAGATIVNALSSVELWYCINTAHDLPIGSSFTATTTSGDQYYLWGAASVSGANGGIDTINIQPGTSGSNTSLSLPTGPLAVANEIIFGIDWCNTNVGFGTYTPDPNFTSLLTTGSFDADFAWKIVSSTASVTWQPSWTNNIRNGAVLASFEATAGPPPSTPSAGGFAWSEC